jgi:TM2 domain-containing membrane protein YozV
MIVVVVIKPIKQKSLGITILLASLVSGVGHIYLGFVKRGVIILILAFVLGFVVSVLLPFPLSFLVLLIYWIWQIYDAYKHYKKTVPA